MDIMHFNRLFGLEQYDPRSMIFMLIRKCSQWQIQALNRLTLKVFRYVIQSGEIKQVGQHNFERGISQTILGLMSFSYDFRSRRGSRVMDPFASPRNLSHKGLSHSVSKSYLQNHSMPTETHVRRYDGEDETLINIHFSPCSEEQSPRKDPKLKGSTSEKFPSQGLDNIAIKQKPFLSHIRYRKQFNEEPSKRLLNMGYSYDLRLASEVYADKVEEKKKKYLNKMELLKSNLRAYDGNNNAARARIQVKILGQQIKRKRASYEIRRGEELQLRMRGKLSQHYSKVGG